LTNQADENDVAANAMQAVSEAELPSRAPISMTPTGGGMAA
jgi:hypothetical protein